MPIPAKAIAQYIDLRSRLHDLEQQYPGISSYYRERVRLVSSTEDQALMNLQVLTASDREAEFKATQAIELLKLRMSEEDAVVELARAFADEGCLDRAIRKVS